MLEDLLTFDAIGALADGRSLSLGEEYFRSGAVKKLTVGENKVSATVTGTERYRVTLAAENGALNYACTCPYHEDEGVFCKHCVAVALKYQREFAGFRTAIVEDAPAVPSRRRARSVPKTVTAEHLREWLAAQNAGELAAIIWEHAKEDLDWRRRLFVRVAANTQAGVNVAALRKTIEDATKTRSYPDAKQIKTFLKNVGEVLITLKELLELGEARPAQELTLLAFDRVVEVYARSNAAGEEQKAVIREIIAVFRAAVVAAPPDPVELAAALFERHVSDGYGFWEHPAETYADVLGEEGQGEFRHLAERAWEKYETLTPADRYYRDDNRRRVTDLMENYARTGGDTDTLVAVLSKDLSNQYRYEILQQTLQEAGRPTEAAAWVESATEVFGARVGREAREFLRAHYKTNGISGCAIGTIWKLFADEPSVENYALLRDFTEATGEGDKWKRDAVALLTKRIAEPPAKTTVAAYRREPKPSERLLAIYLHDGDADAANDVAQTHGADASDWLQIAKLREASHPNESLAIYRRILPQVIENGAPGDAATVLGNIARVYAANGDIESFPQVLAMLREKYPRKRNFLRELAAHGW